ncbi:uncharacterized protein HaLaN_20824 [Haematococcus lacustris]|uniref:Uncharacterized protein n=1 Tax=Haematococcus lacustris TaxID=44745 RepID=A0A699ZY80_HAELA|nr:uncharacterized protein HaLaN_20824 [Haematococcus lacustris]
MFGLRLASQSGAGIYAARIPERWFPGKFDILLHSHQIFHRKGGLLALKEDKKTGDQVVTAINRQHPLYDQYKASI